MSIIELRRVGDGVHFVEKKAKPEHDLLWSFITSNPFSEDPRMDIFNTMIAAQLASATMKREGKYVKTILDEYREILESGGLLWELDEFNSYKADFTRLTEVMRQRMMIVRTELIYGPSAQREEMKDNLEHTRDLFNMIDLGAITRYIDILRLNGIYVNDEELP